MATPYPISPHVIVGILRHGDSSDAEKLALKDNHRFHRKHEAKYAANFKQDIT